jgi:hypothetical protein
MTGGVHLSAERKERAKAARLGRLPVGEVTIRQGATGAWASWAGREAEAQWEEGGAAGKKIRMGRGWAEMPDGPEVMKKISFPNKI